MTTGEKRCHKTFEYIYLIVVRIVIVFSAILLPLFPLFSSFVFSVSASYFAALMLFIINFMWVAIVSVICCNNDKRNGNK